MKIINIYHSIDLDGQMSAAIVEHWFKENTINKLTDDGFKNGFNSNKNSIDFLGYNYGDPLPDLSEYDKVIMCDISFPKEIMANLCEYYGSNFIWIDHHISAILEQEKIYNDKLLAHVHYNRITGLRDTKFAACELTWKYFIPNEPIPEIVRLLGLYDSFRHKGTDEENKVLEFQYGARSYITDYKSAYKYLVGSINDYKINIVIQTAGKDIYNYLCTEAKQTYKNGFPIYLELVYGESCKKDNFGNTIYSSSINKYKFICINKERFNPINFGIDYHKDGYDGCACFHYANGMWNFSLYNDNGKVDCSAIAKQYLGGGHRGASGFRIKDITQIIK